MIKPMQSKTARQLVAESLYQQTKTGQIDSLRDLTRWLIKAFVASADWQDIMELALKIEGDNNAGSNSKTA